MHYSKYLISLWQILLFILGLQGCLVSYLPDTFLVPVFFSSLLKICQTDLKCFMHIVMKTICLILRVTVQKLSAESGLACICIYAVNACLHSSWLCTSQPLSSLHMGTRFKRCVEGASESPLLNFCHQRDGGAGMFSQSVIEFAPFLRPTKSSLPKMTFSSS